jgi:ABC-type branched-subunit amino acid transport system substrate-binding protein
MAAPIVLGVLYDFPQHDGGASFEAALRLGLETVTLDRDVEFVARQSDGLPGGSAASVEQSFAELVTAGVLAVAGPSISDNGMIVRDLADTAGLACINYTGGEHTRSDWMFHYQVGSLTEEPVLLAEHLSERRLASAAVVHDHSPVGSRYAHAFDAACRRHRIEITGRSAVAPLAEDATGVVDRLRAAKPDALVYLGLGVVARAVALAVESLAWDVPVVANSALMFGYARRDWRAGWEGWTYVDTVADDNTQRAALRAQAAPAAAGPIGCAAYDIGRLFGDALARTEHLTRAGVRDALEQIKRLPATSGHVGTTMGFGVYDHGALKGDYLVLREWRAGKTVQLR